MQRHLPHAPVGTRRQAAVILQGTYPGRILLPVDLRAPAAPLVERAVAQHLSLIHIWEPDSPGSPSTPCSSGR